MLGVHNGVFSKRTKRTGGEVAENALPNSEIRDVLARGDDRAGGVGAGGADRGPENAAEDEADEEGRAVDEVDIALVRARGVDLEQDLAARRGRNGGFGEGQDGRRSVLRLLEGLHGLRER